MQCVGVMPVMLDTTSIVRLRMRLSTSNFFKGHVLQLDHHKLFIAHGMQLD